MRVVEAGQRGVEATAGGLRRDVRREFLIGARVFGADCAQHVRACPGDRHALFQLARISQDGQPVGRTNTLGQRRHGHARIDGEHAVGRGKQRVDLDLGDLADIHRELRQPYRYADDGVAVGRRAGAPASEQPVDARARPQFARQRHVDRRQRQRRVDDQFDRRAALTEQHDRAELPALDDAADQLVGIAAPGGRRLHEEAFDARLRPGGGHARRHRIGRARDGSGVSPTRYSCILISRGTPISMARSDPCRHAGSA